MQIMPYSQSYYRQADPYPKPTKYLAPHYLHLPQTHQLEDNHAVDLISFVFVSGDIRACANPTDGTTIAFSVKSQLAVSPINKPFQSLHFAMSDVAPKISTKHSSIVVASVEQAFDSIVLYLQIRENRQCFAVLAVNFIV